jgi:ubiquinone/menaquinone biosynthesis C-methylase UbiE
MDRMNRPPICDYEGSPYQQVFWDNADRLYEDIAEANAIKAMLPRQSGRLLELGAGAGRNTGRYTGFDEIILLDYSVSQLQQARARHGTSSRFTYVAANIYSLPFVNGSFTASTMIRTMHHMADPLAALVEINRVLSPHAFFLLEYANKRNLKSMARYFFGLQKWSPFHRDSIEFAELNFNFHPQQMNEWLGQAGFSITRQRTVSHFRAAILKRIIPAAFLARLDSLAGLSSGIIQVSPSIFVASLASGKQTAQGKLRFQCPECHSDHLDQKTTSADAYLLCGGCDRRWGIKDGIYDFHAPLIG